jgi:hypothetical protein
MVRFIDQCIDVINIDKILYEIHQFMKAFPAEFWKSDPSRPDTPLRTIKTITYLLVQQKGESIYDHLSLVTDQQNSELLPYIQRAIKQLSKGEPRDGSDGMPGTPTRPGSSNTGVRINTPISNPYSKAGSRKENNKELEEILDKLSNPDDAQSGFMALFKFTVDNPNCDIKSHLQKSSTEYFETFVLDGLAKVRDSGVAPSTDGDQNGRSTNGVSRKTYQESGLSGETPRIPIRSKLATISGNTSIPTLRSSPRRTSVQQIPHLPPTDQMTKGDVADWLKACTALLGKDPAKFQDPQFIDDMLASVNEKYNITNSGTEVDIQVARRMADDAQESLKVFKAKYNL